MTSGHVPLLFILSAVLGPLACTYSGTNASTAEVEKKPAGKLMIIGGGERTDELISAICRHAGLAEGDSVGIFPMSSEVPDSAFLWSSEHFVRAGYPTVNLNPILSENQSGLADKVATFKLVFISGGDQNRFMDAARLSGLDTLLPRLYAEGLCISGTSAGAAVMSEIMITGDQKREVEYEGTYARLMTDNAVYSSGLGLLKSVIVDQHFIARSRYNRALTALCDHPGKAVWGIEESTAALVSGDSLTVLGHGQVIIFSPIAGCDTLHGLLGVDEVKLRVLLPGESERIH